MVGKYHDTVLEYDTLKLIKSADCEFDTLVFLYFYQPREPVHNDRTYIFTFNMLVLLKRQREKELILKNKTVLKQYTEKYFSQSHVTTFSIFDLFIYLTCIAKEFI